MQLRVIEIEAIKTRILNELSSKIEYPDFNEKLEAYKKALVRIEDLKDKMRSLNKEMDNIYTKFPTINKYVPGITADNVVEKHLSFYKTKLETEYKNSKLPTALDIQNDIILSSNKDLSELVKELISKYSK
jgi:hypothetical protein